MRRANDLKGTLRLDGNVRCFHTRNQDDSAISPSFAEDGRVLRRGASLSLHPLSSVPMFLLTFSLRMERMTLTMLTLVSGTLHRI